MNNQEKFIDQTSLKEITRLVREESTEVKVQRAANGLPNWIIQEGYLCNSQTDYFKMGVFRDDLGKLKLFLQQEEEALVALLVTRTVQGTFFLVSLRSEPGLIDKTCISTTIQSTYSNYSQKHGGKETPYLNLVQGNTAGKLLLDSTQFDSCDFYDGKTKRFRVVEVAPETVVSPGFAWLSLDTIKKILYVDNLASTDLRACLALSWEIFATHNHETKKAFATPLLRLAKWQQEHQPKLNLDDISSIKLQETGHDIYVDDYGNRIEFFQTEATSREVSNWVQPLLTIKESRRITLYELCEGEKTYPIIRSTQMGTDGTGIWFPSEPLKPLGTQVVGCLMSGEGGRFYKHQIPLELRSLASDSDTKSPLWPAETIWVNRGEMSELIKTPLYTSLELRSAWSLIVGLDQ